ncbi:MAG: arginine repressor [Acidobacteria bacterium]|nr:arginine repressor [Acidobacteriota bacterium]
MKARRQSAIREIVEHEAVRSQDQLRRRLIAQGFDVTQATLSRDIKDLGLVKRATDGAYQPAGLDAPTEPAALPALSRALGQYMQSLDVSQQLVVMRTGPGQAALLALAIDRARLPAIIGTIAGDDTILVICRDARAARTVANEFEGFAEKREASPPRVRKPWIGWREPDRREERGARRQGAEPAIRR